MRSLAATFLALTLSWAISAPAQSTPATATQTPAPSPQSPLLPKGTRLLAKLTTKLDTKHTKTGQPVVLEVTKDAKSGEDVVLAKGSLIKGTVSAVAPFSKGKSNASFDIILDTVTTKSGQSFPNHFAIFALAAHLEKQPEDIYNSGGKKGLPTSAGISGHVDAPRDLDLTPESTGIFGFEGIELHPLVRMTPPTATVDSSSGNIVLEKETMLVLQSLGQ